MRPETPEIIAGWDTLRRYLSLIGIHYKTTTAIQNIFRKKALPYLKSGRPPLFPRESVEAFVKVKTGVTLERWLAQREEDVSKGREATSVRGGHPKGAALLETFPLYFVAASFVSQEHVLRRPDGFVYASYEAEVAASWDTSWFTGRARVAAMSNVNQMYPKYVRMSPKQQPIRGPMQVLVVAVTFGDDGELRPVRVPGGLIGCDGTTDCLFHARAPNRPEIVDYVEGLDRTTLWLSHSNPVNINPVTLEPLRPEAVDQKDLIRLALPEFNL